MPTCFGHLENEAYILQHEIKLSDAILISALLYCGKLDNWKSTITRSLMKHLQNNLRITGVITEVVTKCERTLEKYTLLPNLGDDNLKWACIALCWHVNQSSKEKGRGQLENRRKRLRQPYIVFQHGYVDWLVELASTHTERTAEYIRHASIL